MTYLALERVGKVVVIQQFRQRSRSLLGLIVGSNRRRSLTSRRHIWLLHLGGGWR